jgi:hypothetical protein
MNKCDCKACNPKIKIKTVKIPKGYNWRDIARRKDTDEIEIEFVELVGNSRCTK